LWLGVGGLLVGTVPECVTDKKLTIPPSEVRSYGSVEGFTGG